MLHLSGGLLLLLAPACTSEVDLEGWTALGGDGGDRFFSVYPCRQTLRTMIRVSFSTDDEIQINGGSQTVTYRKEPRTGGFRKRREAR